MNNLTLLYKTRDVTQANILKGMLEGNNIPAFLMNKQDSSYLNFGDVELYVDKDFLQQASLLLQQALGDE